MDFEQKFRILAMALRLGNAVDFKVTGEEGKENYQFLFSQFKKMIEMLELEIDSEKKESICRSLQRTIDFYDTETPSEVQALLETLKNDDPTNFVIIPAYMTRPEILSFLPDAMYGLLIHKKNNRYVVSKTIKEDPYDSLGLYRDDINFYTTTDRNSLPDLSQILFQSKQEHHKESTVSVGNLIKELNNDKSNCLPIKWAGYRGMDNCPINEMLAVFRVALFHCKNDIFEQSRHLSSIKPKFVSSKAFHECFYLTFQDKNRKKYKHLWEIYMERKNKEFCKALYENYCRKTPAKDRKYRDREIYLSQYFLDKVLAHPNTPDSFKRYEKRHHNKPLSKHFRVFPSDSKDLQIWDMYSKLPSTEKTTSQNVMPSSKTKSKKQVKNVMTSSKAKSKKQVKNDELKKQYGLLAHYK